MADDPVLAPWRRMRRAGFLLAAVCALLLALVSPALRHGWLQGRIPEDILAGSPQLLGLGLAGGGLAALLAAIKLRRRPPL